MKSIPLILSVFLLSTVIYAQSGALELINQYSGKEGFTTITISKGLFKMLSKLDPDDPDYDKVKKFSSKLNHFKILVAEDLNDRNFKSQLNEISNSLNRKGYEELMSIQEGKNSIVKISVLEKVDRIQELVLSVLDDTDAVLMVINGDFTLEEIVDIADDVEIDGLEEIKKAKKKA